MPVIPSEQDNPVRGRLSGRKALITGGASGIGLATAKMFCAAGAQVVVLDIDATAIAGLEARDGLHSYCVDLTNESAARSSVDWAGQRMQGIDAVVNCAGVPNGTHLDAMELGVWNKVMAINLTAPYIVCRAALPWLKARPGSTIVNIASSMGMLPDVGGVCAYAASKGGLIAFSKALAAELAPAIRVNVLCPGLAQTPMAAPLLRDSAIAETVLKRYALRRAAVPTEIANGILFLTSSESAYVTGATLAVDGGRTFH
jgi:NAD(P)-dependent dehydrogenase (short-subunit alcohol dehydrogenase family)